MSDFISKILDAQTDSNMKKLFLDGFDRYQKTELVEEDKRLINSLLNSSQTQLNMLSLKDNNIWWGDEEASAHLCSFIKEQSNLKVLDLDHNNLSSSATEQVLSALLESTTTIEEVSLQYSADFSTDKACTLLV